MHANDILYRPGKLLQCQRRLLAVMMNNATMSLRIFNSLSKASAHTTFKHRRIIFNKLCHHSTHSHVKPDDRFSTALDRDSRVATVARIGKSKASNYYENSYAVLVSLCRVSGVPSLLYTVRSSELKSHSSQVSFPGGACDPTDRDVIHSALRETEEEIGVPQGAIDVWAAMPMINPGKKIVYPVIGDLGNLVVDELKHNQCEVSKIFTVPLEFLCDQRNYRYTLYRYNQAQKVPSGRNRFIYSSPVFLTQPRIWGLTAVITELFLHYTFPDIIFNPYARRTIT